MQQTYPTNIVAHIELLISVKLLCDRQLPLSISQRPNASARPPEKKNPNDCKQILASTLAALTYKALPSQTQSQLACGSWYFLYVLCGFLILVQAEASPAMSVMSCIADFMSSPGEEIHMVFQL